MRLTEVCQCRTRYTRSNSVSPYMPMGVAAPAPAAPADLEELDFTGKQLTGLPELGSMPRLTVLSLDGNSDLILNHTSIDVICSQLPALRVICLSDTSHRSSAVASLARRMPDLCFH